MKLEEIKRSILETAIKNYECMHLGTLTFKIEENKGEYSISASGKLPRNTSILIDATIKFNISIWYPEYDLIEMLVNYKEVVTTVEQRIERGLRTIKCIEMYENIK